MLELVGLGVALSVPPQDPVVLLFGDGSELPLLGERRVPRPRNSRPTPGTGCACSVFDREWPSSDGASSGGKCTRTFTSCAAAAASSGSSGPGLVSCGSAPLLAT